ncbi:MAG: Uma2 family endonuclease [Caldilineaceae bacterium]
MDDSLIAAITSEAPAELGIEIDYSQIITEDDEPVDNLFSAKQQRLLVEPLYSTDYLPRPFLADANVGIFAQVGVSAIVPDMFLSLDIEAPAEWWEKKHRSYFIWEYGKPPDVVVEVVSNKEGRELSRKLRDYARMGVSYYVVFDPQHLLQTDDLQVYELHAGQYLARPDELLPRVNLALTIWEGPFEEAQAAWLRWCDMEDNLLLTGIEQSAQERQRADDERQRADEARQRADEERQRADEERQRAETERQRAEEARHQAAAERQRADEERQRSERLAEKLRALGVEPDSI